MTFAITYTDNIDTVNSKGLSLADAGKHKQYLRRSELGRLVIMRSPVPVAYSGNKSLCFMQLSLADIIGGEDGYTGLLADLGLECLAYSENMPDAYNQIENGDSVTLAKYESVKPRIKLLDSEGNETGETKFNCHGVLAIRGK